MIWGMEQEFPLDEEQVKETDQTGADNAESGRIIEERDEESRIEWSLREVDILADSKFVRRRAEGCHGYFTGDSEDDDYVYFEEVPIYVDNECRVRAGKQAFSYELDHAGYPLGYFVRGTGNLLWMVFSGPNGRRYIRQGCCQPEFIVDPNATPRTDEEIRQEREKANQDLLAALDNLVVQKKPETNMIAAISVLGVQNSEDPETHDQKSAPTKSTNLPVSSLARFASKIEADELL
jgi:hypothetical protein